MVLGVSPSTSLGELQCGSCLEQRQRLGLDLHLRKNCLISPELEFLEPLQLGLILQVGVPDHYCYRYGTAQAVNMRLHLSQQPQAVGNRGQAHR